MSSSEPKPKVASITVIVDDSPVVMIFNNIQAALKLKRRLREVFPDTVFTKNITDEMLEKQAKKIAGLMIQRRLFISPTLNGEDLRVEIQGKINNNPFGKKSAAHVTVGTPFPVRYRSVLNEKIKEAERCVGKVSSMSQPQASVIDGCSKTIHAIPSASMVLTKSDQQQAQGQFQLQLQFQPQSQQPQQQVQMQMQQQTQQQQQPPPQAFVRQGNSYIGSVLTTAAVAGTSQTQGDIALPTASVAPLSIPNGSGASLANANVLGTNATNTGHNILTVGALPIAQGNTSNIAAQAAINSTQGQQLRILTIQQMQANSAANQSGGYTGTLGGRILTSQAMQGVNYQGLAAYAAAGSQSTPYIATVQQPGQQLTQIMSNPVVLAQLASTAVMGKVASQQQGNVPITVQSAAIPIPISSANSFGQAVKIQLGSADLSSSTSTIATTSTANSQHVNQIKVSDPLPSSPSASYDAQKSTIPDHSEIALTVSPNKSNAYNSAREVFYTNPHNILSADGKPSTEKTASAASPLLELITEWSSRIRQARPASPMSVTQQDGKFYQHYKKVSASRDTGHTIAPRIPELWPPANQLSLFISIYDQLFSKTPNNIKQTWEEYKQAFLNSSVTDKESLAHTVEKAVLDDNDLSSSSLSSSSSPVQSSFSPESPSSLSSSSKTVTNVTDTCTAQSNDEQETSKSATSIPLQFRETIKGESTKTTATTEPTAATTATLPTLSAVTAPTTVMPSSGNALAFAKNIFANPPIASNSTLLQTGQGLLNFADSNKFFSNTLAQFSTPINLNDFVPKNSNLPLNIIGSNLSTGMDNRMKQDVGPQEMAAQMLANLNGITNPSGLVNANPNDINSILRSYYNLPIANQGSLNNLSLKTMFSNPIDTSNCVTQPFSIDCLFPPIKTVQIDIILLLYLLAFGGNIEGVQIQSNNSDLNLLFSETSSQVMKDYTYKKCDEIKDKLLTLYRKEDFFKVKKSTINLYSCGNIRSTVSSYIVCAQHANLSLHMALQTNGDPEKAMLDLPCMLLDKEHLSFVLSRAKENATGKDKDIDRLLKSIMFLNGQLTRKEFYNKGKASQMIPPIPPVSLGANTGVGAELKKHVRL